MNCNKTIKKNVNQFTNSHLSGRATGSDAPANKARRQLEKYQYTTSDYFGNHRRSQSWTCEQMHDKLFCCAMQKTKPSVSLRKLCSAAVCCNAVCCNKLRSATPQERDAFSQVVHRLEQTMQHCYVQQSSYKRDAAGTRHLLTRRSTRDLEFVWVIARRLKL